MSENTNTTTVASISDTLLEALTASGISASAAGPALGKAEELLKEREYVIADGIISEAAGRYGYGEQAQSVLESAGLSMRPAPEPVVEEAPAEEAPADEETTVAQILALVKAQGESIEKLAAVARRHLGVTEL